MRKVPSQSDCDIRAGGGEVAVTELAPLLLIVVTAAVSGAGAAGPHLPTVRTSLSEGRAHLIRLGK